MRHDFWMKPLLMKPIEDGTENGGGTQDPAQTPQKDPLGETTGDTDEFGYAKAPSGDPEKKEPEVTPPVEKSDFKSGYEEIKEGEEPAPAAPEKGHAHELNIEGLPEAEVSKLNEFISKTGVTKDIAQALVDNKKAELVEQAKMREASEAETKKQIENTKRQWAKELRDDPIFGGKNFDRSIKMAEKLVEEHMPFTKKILTERRGVLPPSTMKDLAKLAERIYGTESKPSGQPTVIDAETEDPDAELNAMYGFSKKA